MSRVVNFKHVYVANAKLVPSVRGTYNIAGVANAFSYFVRANESSREGGARGRKQNKDSVSNIKVADDSGTIITAFHSKLFGKEGLLSKSISTVETLTEVTYVIEDVFRGGRTRRKKTLLEEFHCTPWLVSKN